MADRTIIQWDKDDLDALRLLKVDCLALGMLTCVRKAFDLLRAARAARRRRSATSRTTTQPTYDDDPARRHRRRVPDRIARADGDAAAPEAANASTTW